MFRKNLLCQLITRFKMREASKQEGSAELADVEESAVVLSVSLMATKDILPQPSCPAASQRGARPSSVSFESVRRMSTWNCSAIARGRKSGVIEQQCPHRQWNARHMAE